MTFDVLSEPWITIMTKDGTCEDRSPRDVLAKPDVYLVPSTPYNRIGIIDLLTSMVLSKEGSLPEVAKAFSGDTWDLFGEKPFMQDSSLDFAPQSVVYLDPTSTRSSVIVSDSRTGDFNEVMSCKEAVLSLLMTHRFSLSLPFKGIPSGSHSKASMVPALDRVLVYPSSKLTVEETIKALIGGLPRKQFMNVTWNQEGVTRASEKNDFTRSSKGIADTLSWLSRRVRLIGGVNGVSQVIISRGEKSPIDKKEAGGIPQGIWDENKKLSPGYFTPTKSPKRLAMYSFLTSNQDKIAEPIKHSRPEELEIFSLSTKGFKGQVIEDIEVLTFPIVKESHRQESADLFTQLVEMERSIRGRCQIFLKYSAGAESLEIKNLVLPMASGKLTLLDHAHSYSDQFWGAILLSWQNYIRHPSEETRKKVLRAALDSGEQYIRSIGSLHSRKLLPSVLTAYSILENKYLGEGLDANDSIEETLNEQPVLF